MVEGETRDAGGLKGNLPKGRDQRVSGPVKVFSVQAVLIQCCGMGGLTICSSKDPMFAIGFV